MALNVSMLRIKGAIATAYNNSDFSTVTVRDTAELHSEVYVTLFLEGAGHEDAAARIAALINEQVVRRDMPKMTHDGWIAKCDAEDAKELAQGDDGPTYEDEGGIPDPSAPPAGPTDQWEAGRLDAEQAGELKAALPIREAAEEAAYNAEDEAGKEEYRRQHAED